MPITTSAKKALRQSRKRGARNKQVRVKVRDVVKEMRTLISQKKTQEAQLLLSKLYKTLDKAVKVGVMKKNTASRTKSRLTLSLAKNKPGKSS
ncbi:MAG: 30S ribosomal protein S20 [Candidatus Wildermuthbacteria bacterium RIFCSPHIGHO2_02_FULL_47_12]|uniref:Small ribosomal subunit protein bS20 n=1 Tax=Candidatus Wildermuthbacteria bacterium RIFCSPHIGHO2_02_FULL_47_12 TaxID=1802451 RepID=A0A1G2R1Q2_9BACT|nr:MAG: 30S ribosomal protein S20 [Candidatus Wildermuthbacteria bacterium RIFCSPHIGHO2_02_FULL_47_12]